MVDTLLIAICSISIIAWFVQEKFARTEVNNRLNQVISKDAVLPIEQLQTEVVVDWNQWLLKALFVMWIGWAVSVVMVKDGDFAFVLVMLTLLSGVISGLDTIIFSKSRSVYTESKAVVDHLAKYTQQQREGLSFWLRQEMEIGEYAKSFFPVLAAVLVLRSFIVEPFQIPSGSMVPT